jgi:GNAT superfamily N-acetyltransferase
MTDLRPMTLGDMHDVEIVVEAARMQLERQAGRVPVPRTGEHAEGFRDGMRRFVERDPHGAWVAVSDGSVVGMSTAIRRGSFWGLSMLFVDPEHQSRGIGRLLIDAALAYAGVAEVRMILSSADPRALRRYSHAGLDLHPTVEASGMVDRAAIPDELCARLGDASDLDLVASVDAGLRGSRAEDVEYMLGVGARLHVIEDGAARGYIAHRPGRLLMLGASDEETASSLLWQFLALQDGRVELWGVTARQNWAVKVAYAARLKVLAAGALFISGRRESPGPWLPSGWYF